jgi:hypothetical protein
VDKKHCEGCRDNYYNQSDHSTTGECWLLKAAKIILRKEVPINQRPPWNQKARRFPSCYRREGYVYVEKNATQ